MNQFFQQPLQLLLPLVTQCSRKCKQSQTVRGRQIDLDFLTMHGKPDHTTHVKPRRAYIYLHVATVPTVTPIAKCKLLPASTEPHRPRSQTASCRPSCTLHFPSPNWQVVKICARVP